MTDADDGADLFGEEFVQRTTSDNAPTSTQSNQNGTNHTDGNDVAATPIKQEKSNTGAGDESSEEEESDSENEYEVTLDSTPGAAPSLTTPITIRSNRTRPTPDTGVKASNAFHDAIVSTTSAPAVNPHAVAAYHPFRLPLPNESIYDLNLDMMGDKPWNKAGVDMSDYFNYGFDEETWKGYAAKQIQLRLANKEAQKHRGPGSQPIPPPNFSAGDDRPPHVPSSGAAPPMQPPTGFAAKFGNPPLPPSGNANPGQSLPPGGAFAFGAFVFHRDCRPPSPPGMFGMFGIFGIFGGRIIPPGIFGGIGIFGLNGGIFG